MQAIIVAGGMGSRINRGREAIPKPLYTVGEKHLIEHVILNLKQTGINEFLIIVGFMADKIALAIGDGTNYGVNIKYIMSPYYNKTLGLSLLLAQEYIKGPFILAMSDHLIEFEGVKKIVDYPLNSDSCALLVDKKIEDIFWLDDAAKVKLQGNQILGVSKDYTQYEAIDCGIFKCSPVIFDELKKVKSFPDSMSHAVSVFAKSGRMLAVDIGPHKWIDIDEYEELEAARKMYQQFLKKDNREIRVGIVGVGNCASSLVQGIEYYQKNRTEVGLMNPYVGKYHVTHIKPVVGFDVDARKVGRDMSEAIYAYPNCTKQIGEKVGYLNATVYMGPLLDGVSPHMLEHLNKDQTFMPTDITPVDVAAKLKEHKVHVLVNYLPVGSENATKFYAQAAIDAGCAFVNCIPSFITSDQEWANKFKLAGLPTLGDDIKAQLGATYSHRMLIQAALERGLKIKSTSQFNQGGNTDFLNMTAENRLRHKLASKQESVVGLLPENHSMEQQAYFGPGESDEKYRKKGHGWRDGELDEKTAKITLNGEMWGGIPCYYEINLTVEDSPDSAGVSCDAIRCAKLALDRGMYGAIEDGSFFFFKHPPRQIPDSEAKERLKRFINGN